MRTHLRVGRLGLGSKFRVQLGALDRILVAHSARIRPTSVDRTLLVVSRLANHSVLWAGIASGLAVIGGPPRRGAVRGILAVAGASAAANGIAKPLLPRRRPPDDSVPFVRKLVTSPVSSSFPSGHAASAAAFVTGVALESPAAGLAIAPIAAAVGYSRVHIGVHWPSDVVFGAALGSAVALATRRWWAVRTEEPATLGPCLSVPALPKGRGLLVVVNPDAGSESDPLIAEVQAELPGVRFVEVDPEGDFAGQLEALVEVEKPPALGVCGGDGTVAAVAKVAICHELPLAVFAAGTLNHFARDAGVTDVQATARAVVSGTGALVDVAEVEVDGAPLERFLNTASLGGYPDSVRLRDKWQPRLGKWPAAAAAMIRVLLAAEPMHVRIDGVDTTMWMLFVGNGRYAPADQIPMSRPEIHRRTLDVRYLRADVKASRLRLLGAALAGTLGDSNTYVQRSMTELDVQVRGQEVALATDGEVGRTGRHFRFASRPHGLVLYREGEV